MEKAKLFINQHLVFLLIGLGLGFYFVGNQFFVGELKDNLVELSKLILISGVFSATIKSRQFRDIIRDELIEIIHDNRFLETKQNEFVKGLWKKISKILYTRNFPDISDEIQQVVMDKYFSNTEYYYSEVRHNIKIEKEGTDGDGIYRQIQTSKFTIIPAVSADSILYTFWLRSKKLSQDKDSINIESIKINDEDYMECIEIKRHSRKPDHDRVLCEIPLSGKMNHRIEKEVERIFNIREDNDKNFTSKRFVKKLTVHVLYPPEIELTFSPVGMMDDFDTPVNQTGVREYVYEGLLMPSQGYRLKYNLSNGV